MKIKSLEGWQQTVNVISETLAMTAEKQNATPVGTAEYVALQKLLDQLLEDFKTHSFNGIRIVNDAIKTSGTAKDLAQASKNAKAEADRIKNATKAVGELTKLAGELSKIVVGFASL